MPIHVSDKQLDQMESDSAAAVIVRSERTRKKYALIPQEVHDKLRPLLHYVSVEGEARTQGNGHAVEWTQEMNARRVELINKKHDQGLTTAEMRELKTLMSEADNYRDRTIPIRNDILELILAGLQNRNPKAAKR